MNFAYLRCISKFFFYKSYSQLYADIGCRSNAAAFNKLINNTIKNDFFPKQIFQNHKEAKKVIAKSIQIYNEKRPHASVDYLTPEQAHLKDGKIKKR